MSSSNCKSIDVNSNNIRLQAVESLQRIDLSLAEELQYAGVSRYKGLRLRLSKILGKWLELDEYQKLNNKLRLEGNDDGWITAFNRMQRDPELKSKLSRIYNLFSIGLIVIFLVIPTFIFSLVMRATLFLGNLVANNSFFLKTTILCIGIAIVSYLLPVDKLFGNKKFWRSYISLLRLSGLLLGIFEIIYLSILNWKFSVTLIFFGALLSWIFQRRLVIGLNQIINQRQRNMTKKEK